MDKQVELLGGVRDKRECLLCAFLENLLCHDNALAINVLWKSADEVLVTITRSPRCLALDEYRVGIAGAFIEEGAVVHNLVTHQDYAFEEVDPGGRVGEDYVAAVPELVVILTSSLLPDGW